ncbi:putative mfs transporter [Phaeomoniella chlamydospora]|uniref:Putative mfs transporter n=1 Tax=Phaeomoniella chlamydospora TaxID=158046 RepID=A0A0G2HAV0_PHACM|nr:putative mfs transporter [Phaeomoniella chlamydospora]
MATALEGPIMDVQPGRTNQKGSNVDHHALSEKGSEAGVTITQDSTEAEEAKARRKIDFTLLPILALAFFALQLDRGNISTALTAGLPESLGVDTNAINVGTQLLSAGIVLLEIPSNIVLQKVGPRKWLSVQIFAWGLVATFQAFVSNYASYLATRLLLGLMEAGFIPGSLYYLSTWYKKSETSTRVTLFFFGQTLAGALSQLIGAGLVSLAGKGGWAVEGLITIFVGIVFVLFIPPAVGNGKPLISGGRWSYYTERETYIMRQRVLLDDPLKARGGIKITGGDILDTLKQKRIWLHVLITLTGMSAVQALTTYTPSIIKSLGYDTVKANAMASVPLFCSLVLLIPFSVLADWTGHRGPFVWLIATWMLIAYANLRALPYTVSKLHRYGVVVVAAMPYADIHILNVGWLSVNCKGPQQRSIAMAMVVMAANLAGIAGAQVFRTKDSPKYLTALSTIIGLVAASWILILVQGAQYYLNRKKVAKADEK